METEILLCDTMSTASCCFGEDHRHDDDDDDVGIHLFFNVLYSCLCCCPPRAPSLEWVWSCSGLKTYTKGQDDDVYLFPFLSPHDS